MFNPFEVPPFFDVLVLPPSEFQESLSCAQRLTNGALLVVKDELITEGENDFEERIEIKGSSIAVFPSGQSPNLDDSFFKPVELNFKREMAFKNSSPSDPIYTQVVDIHPDGQMICKTYVYCGESQFRFEGFHIYHPEKNLPVVVPENLNPIGFLQNGDVLVYQDARQQVIRFDEEFKQWRNVSPEGQEVIIGNIEERYGYKFLCPITENANVFLVSPNNPRHREISDCSSITGFSETGVLIGLDKDQNPSYWYVDGSKGRFEISESVPESFFFPNFISTQPTPKGSVEWIVGTCGELQESKHYQPNPLEDESFSFIPHRAALWAAPSESFAEGISPVGIDLNELCIGSDERLVAATSITSRLDIVARTSIGESVLLVRRNL